MRLYFTSSFICLCFSCSVMLDFIKDLTSTGFVKGPGSACDFKNSSISSLSDSFLKFKYPCFE